MSLDRSFLLFLQTGKGIDPPGHDFGFQGMASTTPDHRYNLLTPTNYPGRTAHSEADQIQVRGPRRSISDCIPAKVDFDIGKHMELLDMGRGNQMPQTHQADASCSGQAQGDHDPILPVGHSDRADSEVLSSEADEQESNPERCSSDNSMESG